ncbi:MAG: FAD-binding protein [Deltaproteobacteria bacterium]|nr:FAD-binding protein [Deltaproteobacteria bacterium]
MALPSDKLAYSLEKIVGVNHVLTGADVLERFAKDETPNLTPCPADCVVRPGSTAEVQAVLRYCHEHQIYVTPRGAGTGQSGGCVPIYGGVVMHMERFTKVHQVDNENLIAKVEPGVITGEFQGTVEEEGLFYPPDPASLSYCTLGGNVAENAGGPRALRYGVTREYVLGLEAILADGTFVSTGKQTVKGVAGYDLTALLCGSEGTLAVITGMTLKLLPKPRCVQTALAVFPSSEHAARVVAAILRAGVIPRTLEYMDQTCIEAVQAHGAPYRFPVGAGAALILETDGDDEESTFATLERAIECSQKEGAVEVLMAQDEAQRRKIWQSRRLLSEATRKIRNHKMSEDIVVPRSRIPEMVAKVGSLGEKHGIRTCAFGHAGDGNLHVQMLFDDDDERLHVLEMIGELFALTVEMGGTITGEHGVGIAKRDYLPLEQSKPVLDLQRSIKKAFDPAGILNPGKIFKP